MDLVLDANILFAAFIRNSLSADILFHNKIRLFAPEFLWVEFEKYQEELLRKTSRSELEFFELLSVIKKRVVLVPLEEFASLLSQAERITPDMKDVAYVALALKLSIPIWSNDKSLREKQSIVIVYPTHELIRLLI